MIPKTPRLQAIVKYGKEIYLTDNKIIDTPEESRADAYLKILVYNHFVDKNKVREDTFCKKRCSPALTKDEIVKASDTAAKKIREIEAEEKIAAAAAPALMELNYQRIADIIRERHHVVAYLGIIYRYVDGVYIQDKEGLIDSEIIVELSKIDDFNVDDDITRAAQQVKHYIRFEKPEKENPFNKNRGLYNVSNGVVKINQDTGEHELLPHSHEYRFNYKMVVKYNPEAPIEPMTEYIKNMGDHLLDYLIQIPAHCLLSMDGDIYKKAYFLMGGRDCGKSSYQEMLTKRFFGTSICSTLSLQEMLSDRFKCANLSGKLLNTRGDLPDSKITDIGAFKCLTGGDGMNIERKGVQSEDNFVNRAVFLFSANKYPKITTPEDGGVFWDRWIAIKFNKSFPTDPGFSDKMFTEENMSGLLNLVLMEIVKIKKNGLKLSTDIMDEWLRDSDSSFEFIKKYIEPCTGAVIVKGSIYQEYQRYCIENELPSVDIKVFTKTMGKKPFAYRTDSQHNVGGKRGVHCYTDCKRIGDFPQYPDGYTAPGEAPKAADPGPNKTLA
jgi:phage/plasmid-associated DNA primase